MLKFRDFPNYFLQVLLNILIGLFFLTLTRIVFWIYHATTFHQAGLNEFFVGIYMDAVALGIYMIPYYVFALTPIDQRKLRWHKKMSQFLFLFILIVMMALNLMDVEYFNYTSKRSTSDLFITLTTGEDFKQLIGAFILDFWWLILTFIAFVLLLMRSFFRLQTKKIGHTYFVPLWKRILIFVLGVAGLFVMGRGGFGYRPADMMTAAQWTNVENTGLVLNTPLTIIKTIGKEPLTLKDFFEEAELNKIYRVTQTPNLGHALTPQPNIVIIILESFGNEWLGTKTGGPFTPFLDSLITQSLYFENAFANGKKSIEALPAIVAGIPSWMDHPYISSHYGTNTIQALPKLLGQIGYSSAFFHGATNGSMKFDEFAALAGFEQYFGRREYNNEAHCDATWGVLDEYFNPWTAEQISHSLSPPFLATLFTLSSHHPYFVPEEHRKNLPSGDHPIAQSIAYADWSLRLFFQEAMQRDWFKNTIFVLTGDHTPAGAEAKYNNRLGMFRLPILIFDPQKRIQPKVESRIFSHVDIMPTILDLLGFSEPHYGFGNSYFSHLEKRFALSYLSGTYHFFKGDYMLNFRDDRVENFYNYQQDTMLYQDSLVYYREKSEEYARLLKAIIQRYNFDLIHNNMLP